MTGNSGASNPGLRTPASTIRFGAFEVDFRTHELRKGGIRIKLQEQPFQVLAEVLKRPGELVTREELQRILWGESAIGDFEQGLNRAVNRLREALSDHVDRPRYIETIPRLGYRFIAPVRTESGCGQSTLPRHRRRWMLVGLSAIVALVLVSLARTFWPRPQPVLVPVARVVNDGARKLGPLLVARGPSLYYTALIGGAYGTFEVPIAGGVPREVVKRRTSAEETFLMDVSPDGRELVFSYSTGTQYLEGAPLWAANLIDGSVRRLDNLKAAAARHSPDGSRLAYAEGPDLFISSRDGDSSRKIATLPGAVRGIHWSPDGKRLRFNSPSTVQGPTVVWEASPTGGQPFRVVPDWTDAHSTGAWSPDGKWFLAVRAGHVWAIPDNGRLATNLRPVQVTLGIPPYSGVAVSRDGQRVFAVSASPGRGELHRFDGKKGVFVPFMGGLAGGEVQFSRDGESVVWITHPDGVLVRGTANGAVSVRLTEPPMEATCPRWSPDGLRIAFVGKSPDLNFQLCFVPATGGPLKVVRTGLRYIHSWDWSPDGQSLLLCSRGAHPGDYSFALVEYDIESGRTTRLPKSDGLAGPRYSPDGQWVAAVRAADRALVLSRSGKLRWRQVCDGMALHPTWSPDGRSITFLGGDSIKRLHLPDLRVENLVSLQRIPISRLGTGFEWVGLSPDGDPLVVRTMGGHEIYELEWRPSGP